MICKVRSVVVSFISGLVGGVVPLLVNGGIVCEPMAIVPAAAIDIIAVLPQAKPIVVAASPAFSVVAVMLTLAAEASHGAVILPNNTSADSNAPLPKPFRDNCFCNAFFCTEE